MSAEKSLKIAYDIVLMKPGCVLLQVGMGCDRETAMAFDANDWILAPTPNLRVYPITKSQLPQLVAKTVAARKKPPSEQ